MGAASPLIQGHGGLFDPFDDGEWPAINWSPKPAAKSGSTLSAEIPDRRVMLFLRNCSTKPEDKFKNHISSMKELDYEVVKQVGTDRWAVRESHRSGPSGPSRPQYE